MSDADKPTPGRKSMRRFALIFGGALFAVIAIFILLILILAGNDLTRDVPTPKLVAEVLAEQDHTATAPQSGTNTTTQTVAQDRIYSLGLIPDSKTLPDEVRKHRDELNADILKFNANIEAFRREWKSIPNFEQFQDRWWPMTTDLGKAVNPIWRAYGIDTWSTDTAFTQTVGVSTGIRMELDEYWEEACVRYGEWRRLGREAERDGHWDEAVYYWRRNGIEGRIRIISGSMARSMARVPAARPFLKYIPYEGPEKYASSRE